MVKDIIYQGKKTNYIISSDGRVFNKSTGVERTISISKDGYCSVVLPVDDKQISFRVNRLVAIAFCENDNPQEKIFVDHIDRNRKNNNYLNLRWVTPQENNKNMIRPKQHKSGYKIKNINMEEWKETKIPGYYANVEGEILKVCKTVNRILSGSLREGYVRYCILGKHYSGHRLIYETFCGEIPENMVIDHIDGNRSNNKLNNLRLVSYSDNAKNRH